jgi:hypothetical protein
MARTVRGGRLETRSARLKLVPRPRGYWITTAKAGLHLGYRRLKDHNGTWIARTYQGQSGTYVLKAFAQADDYSESDGDEVLTYFEAAQRIAGAAPPVRHSSAYSVKEAVVSYLDYITRHRRSIADARSRLTAYVVALQSSAAVPNPSEPACPCSRNAAPPFGRYGFWPRSADQRAIRPSRAPRIGSRWTADTP